MVNTSKAIQSLWKGKCTVLVREERKNSVTKRIEFDETTLLKDEPCRLSIKNMPPASGLADAAVANQMIKLFILPQHIIPAGSKIIVSQNGVTNIYTRSSAPAVYTNHQEIVLELFSGWL